MMWSVVIDYFPRLLSGALVTLELVILSLMIGFIIAIPNAVLLQRGKPWQKALPSAYVFFFRGTPLLVQIFLIYYGVSQFEWIRESFLWSVLKEPYWCAIIAFSLNTGAYTAEIFRGGLANIPKGEIEAAKSLGFSPLGAFIHIEFPRALRLVLPAYSNEVILMIKASALASTITLLDLTGIARTIIARTYTPIEIFTAAGAIYLVISMSALGLFHWWEKRLAYAQN